MKWMSQKQNTPIFHVVENFMNKFPEAQKTIIPDTVFRQNWGIYEEILCQIHRILRWFPEVARNSVNYVLFFSVNNRTLCGGKSSLTLKYFFCFVVVIQLKAAKTLPAPVEIA